MLLCSISSTPSTRRPVLTTSMDGLSRSIHGKASTEQVLARPADTTADTASIEPTLSAAERDIEEAHAAACARGDPMYLDPATQYSVMTRDYLLKRKKCCGSKCRHCPYDHVNVKKPPAA